MEFSSQKSSSEVLQKINPRQLSAFTIKTIVYIVSLLLFISASAVFYCNYEGWTPEIAFGFAIVTLSTVGYGYHHPTDDNSRLFTIFFMLFGVYFVFAGLNEVIAMHMEYVMKRDTGTSGERYLATRRRFVINIFVIILTLFIGAFSFMALEDWTFITALYFAIETTTTIGFGDVPMPKMHTRVFMGLYILLSAGLVTYAFSSLHLMKAGIKALNEDEERTLKRRELEFMMRLDTGSGVTQAEFILAILEQQGIIDARKDIGPWKEKFQQLDVTHTGRVYRRELETFHRQEAVLATSHLEEISRDRSASITTGLPVLNAAERMLRSPWTSMDDGPVRGGRTASGQLSSSPNSMMNEQLMPMLPEGHY